MTPAFEMRETVKRYPGFTLGPLTIDLQPGTVLGYIGPNGSGKSTTLHCLTGLVRADEGEIRIFGRTNDLSHPGWKNDIGYVGDEHVFYEGWSGRKNLDFMSNFYEGWSDELADDLARRFHLDLGKAARTLSKGNRVKLSLVAALSHSPKLLLLDEPTAGLDPVIRDELLDILFEIVESGERAILYSTHILSDISRIADDLIFLDNGVTVLRSHKDDLIDRWRRISFTLPEDVVYIESAVSHEKEGNTHLVISSDGTATLSQLSALGAKHISENRMSIDEIAVRIMRDSAGVNTKIIR